MHAYFEMNPTAQWTVKAKNSCPTNLSRKGQTYKIYILFWDKFFFYPCPFTLVSEPEICNFSKQVNKIVINFQVLQKISEGGLNKGTRGRRGKKLKRMINPQHFYCILKRIELSIWSRADTLWISKKFTAGTNWQINKWPKGLTTRILPGHWHVEPVSEVVKMLTCCVSMYKNPPKYRRQASKSIVLFTLESFLSLVFSLHNQLLSDFSGKRSVPATKQHIVGFHILLMGECNLIPIVTVLICTVYSFQNSLSQGREKEADNTAFEEEW